ncbi:MAG: winged helix-turn-helix domain-containing protein [Burkholderiaceae bacterium]
MSAGAAPLRVLLALAAGETYEMLAEGLSAAGVAATPAADVAQSRACLARQSFDIAVVDSQLPDEGLELCRHLASTQVLPVILAVPAGDRRPLQTILDTGADDYLFLPCRPQDLIDRIHAVLRRRPHHDAVPDPPTRHRFNGWVLEAERRLLIDPAGQAAALSATETRLLAALIRRPNTILSRDELIDLVLGEAAAHGETVTPADRRIDTHVSRLRRKLEPDPRHPRMLKTAWGNGYVLIVETAPPAA